MGEKPKRNSSAADEIVIRAREILEAGNTRRFVVKRPTDDVLLDVSVTMAVLLTGVLVFVLPLGMFWLFAAVVAAIFMRLKVEVVRVVGNEDMVVTGETLSEDDEDLSRLDEDYKPESQQKA